MAIEDRVLIAGAGPVGLTAAANLVRAGVPVTVLEAGTDLRTIQLLLGHSTLEHTLVYLHLSHKHLQTVPNPLDQLQISNLDDVQRSRRLQKK